MKLRACDSASKVNKHNPDNVWTEYSHYLIKAFSELSSAQGFTEDEIEQIYSPRRSREIDEQFIPSLVFNVAPAHVETVLGDPTGDDALSIEGTRGTSKASPHAPFILLGYVGAGKSTYLEYHFLSLAKAHPTKLGVIINFEDASPDSSTFLIHLLSEVDRWLADFNPKLAGANRVLLYTLFETEIRNIEETLHTKARRRKAIDELLTPYLLCMTSGNTSQTLDLIGRKIALLKSEGYDIWLVLDNIDQHMFSIHHTAFLEAISCASKWNTGLIITMRGITFGSLIEKQVFASYRPRRLTLSPPNVVDIVERRMRYFKEIAAPILNRPLPWTWHTATPKDLAAEIAFVLKLLSANNFVRDVLLPLSNRNLRRLLELILLAFQSYYFFYDRFNYERYLPYQDTLFQRFIFGHILKNGDFFFPTVQDVQERCIINLYDNDLPLDPSNSFVRIRLLQLFISTGNGSPLELSEILRILHKVFRHERQSIERALIAFAFSELIACRPRDSEQYFNPRTSRSINVDDHLFTITSCGHFHYELLSRLQYVEIMKFSTYIDAEHFEEVTDDRHQTTIGERRRSTLAFLRCLQQEEAIELVQIKSRAAFQRQFAEVMPKVIAQVTREYDKLLQKPTVGREKSP